MIVKFFTRGTGGSAGVFNYLLKDDKQPDSNRQGAELLRGDVVNQSLLIDSLDFKQKYTSGCLSFAESADEVTQEQKEALMNGFEETIRAGLDSDRIAVTWVEHRDKGRLELNFVFANVDLKHGRAFQPYVHSQDLKRVNAWKDLANIEYGFKDPNDPQNKRLLAQRDNLPRDVKQARQALTEGLTALVAEGVIKSRTDVVKALTDGGFEVARETPKAISIKNPEGGRNIRLTGGIYERDFNFSRNIQEEVERASREHRASARQRYDEAKRLYDSEIVRKREYHEERHGQPKRAERTITANAQTTRTRYTYSPDDLYKASPSPFNTGFKRTRRRSADDDRELRREYASVDKEQRESNSLSHQIRFRKMGDGGRDSLVSDIYSRGVLWGLDSEQSDRASDLQVLSRQQERSNLYVPDKSEVNHHGQAITRQDRPSADSTARDNTATASNAQRQRQRYSRVAELAKTVSSNADRTTRALADSLRAIEEHDSETERLTSLMDETSQRIQSVNVSLNGRVATVSRASNSTDKAYERVSEYDSTTRDAKGRYGAIRERIGRASTFTAENNQQSELTEKTAAGVAELVENLKLVQQQEQQKQQEEVRASRSYSPRMR